MDLTDDQWNAVRHLLPQELNQGRGRPPQSSRRVLDAVLWKLRTGAAWNDLPPEYPSHQTCFRRFTEWERSGLLEALVNALSKHLSSSGFNLNKAIQDKEIELITVAKRSHIRFIPRWQDTWQASTALLILQRHLAGQRRQGLPLPKVDLAHPVSE